MENISKLDKDIKYVYMASIETIVSVLISLKK